MNENIDKALDIKKTEEPKVEIIESPNVIETTSSRDSHADKDYGQVRSNLKNIIQTSENAVENLLNLALGSDNPRAYEVLSDLIKTTVDANMKLVELQKQMQEIKGESKESGPTITNNSVFVGSTAELLKLMKKSKSKD